ncbi:MAG: hypothetical protein ABSB01_06960 [Streptosporangiaceae bacterium]|jgi:pimeloyl-ACP methyl ester carboxylesterase
MQRSKLPIRFKNSDVDYTFQWMLSYGAYGGLSFGEAFSIAAQIDEHSPASWVHAFHDFAELLRERAADLLRQGKLRSAGETCLKAFNAERSAVQLMSPRDPAFIERVRAFKADFAAAMSYLGLPVAAVEIAYADQRLPGWFLKASRGARRGPTLIQIGGGDSYCEDLYFFGGAAGYLRGYNLLLADLPGQGDTPALGLHFTEAYDAPVRAVVDHVLARRDVDPRRLAIFGMGGGGYFVTRGAARDQRLKACAASTPILDVSKVVNAEMPAAIARTPMFMGGLLQKMAANMSPAARVSIDKYLWQFGVTDIAAGLAITRSWQVDPEQITCPVLCLAGESDTPECVRQARELYEKARGPGKSLRIFTEHEGADAHCQVNNLPLQHQVLFDWLDDVFAR